MISVSQLREHFRGTVVSTETSPGTEGSAGRVTSCAIPCVMCQGGLSRGARALRCFCLLVVRLDSNCILILLHSNPVVTAEFILALTALSRDTIDCFRMATSSSTRLCKPCGSLTYQNSYIEFHEFLQTLSVIYVSGWLH